MFGQERVGAPTTFKRKPRIAIVHHWFVSWGGGEKVAESFAALFPTADIFTLLAKPQVLSPLLRGHRVYESRLAKVPGARSHHRNLLPLYPWAVKGFDLSGYDLVLSSDSGPVKGVTVGPHTTHICYCHSPMRYLWDQYEAYRQEMRGIARACFSQVAPRVRQWDFDAAQKVTHFIANSRFVAQRIRSCYGRESRVIYPGIETSRGRISQSVGNSYLYAGRLVPYKRVDLLIEACNRLKRKLRIVGVGPEEKRLRSMAGDTIEFLGWKSTEELWREYADCRALLFAAEEDCGMVPLEAQSCGRPVIAYGKGGSLETVDALNGPNGISGTPSGIFFYEQSAEAAASAILSFEDAERIFIPYDIQRRARSFDIVCFQSRIKEFVSLAVPPELELEL